MNSITLQKNKLQSGFTLVETLVAISIFTISVLTMLIVLSQGISSTIYAKKKATAGYLAQEGIEYMRNMRDTYVLYDSTSPQTGWDAFNIKTLTNCNTVNGCYVNGDTLFAQAPPQQMTKIPLTACGITCPAMLYDATTAKYGYTFGKNSGFIRRIVVSPVAGTPHEVTVTSTVYWKQGSGNYQITFSEELFNWVE